MVVYDVPTKVVDKEISPQHTIADLNLWHFIYCFFQSGKAFTVEGNKDTHTRTATHNHTRAHTRAHAHTHGTTEKFIIGQVCNRVGLKLHLVVFW